MLSTVERIGSYPLNIFRRSRKTKRRGVATLEFAIVLPIFLLLIIGILEFGRAVMIHQIVTNAAREASRQAIIRGAADKQVLGVVENYLDSASIKSSGRTVEIRDASGGAATLSTINSHETVTIFISVPLDENSFGISNWFINSDITTSVTMRRE